MFGLSVVLQRDLESDASLEVLLDGSTSKVS